MSTHTDTAIDPDVAHRMRDVLELALAWMTNHSDVEDLEVALAVAGVLQEAGADAGELDARLEELWRGFTAEFVVGGDDDDGGTD